MNEESALVKKKIYCIGYWPSELKGCWDKEKGSPLTLGQTRATRPLTYFWVRSMKKLWMEFPVDNFTGDTPGFSFVVASHEAPRREL